MNGEQNAKIQDPMKKDEVKNIIVDLVQKTLKEKIDLKSDINPQLFAEALITKIDFSKPSYEIYCEQIIEKINDAISDYEKDMNGELNKLNENEKLLANFIRGKLTAYQEMMHTIKNL